MSVNSNAPHFVSAAVQRIYPLLPDLIGADWQNIQPQVDAYLTALRTQPDAYSEAAQLIALLTKHEPARQRLAQELTVQRIITENIVQPVQLLAAPLNLKAEQVERLMAAAYAGLRWEVDPETVPPPEDTAKRTITLEAGGAAGARSVKFRNIDFDLHHLLTVCAGFLLMGMDMLESPTPLVIVGSILVIAGELCDEMTVEIDQQDATVFWGFIVATNEQLKERRASADVIFSVTNAQRGKYGMPALTDDQFRHSLYKLEQLGSIARVDGDMYKIIESFRVKG
jgi:hypothetical protein